MVIVFCDFVPFQNIPVLTASTRTHLSYMHASRRLDLRNVRPSFNHALAVIGIQVIVRNRNTCTYTYTVYFSHRNIQHISRLLILTLAYTGCANIFNVS